MRTQLMLGSTLALAATSVSMGQLAPPASISASDGTLTTGVAIAWSAVEGASTYRVFRRLGNAAPVQLASTDLLEFLDASATVGVEFDYFVRAENDAEQSDPSAGDSGWRNVPPPANFTASDGTNPNSVILNWSQVQGNQGYRVFRGPDAGSLEEIAISNSPNHHDSTAVPGTVYTYMVKVRLAPGDSAPSPTDTGFRAGDPPNSVPSGLQASDGTSVDGVELAWNGVADAEGYRVLRGLPGESAGEIAFVSETSYFDDSAVAGIVYAYSVRAVVGGVDSEPSSPNTGWRNLPAPSDFSASDGSETAGVLLSWAPVEGALEYRVFRRRGQNNPNTPAVQIAVVTESTYLDTATMVGRTHFYFVRAASEAGLTAASDQDSGFRAMPAPANLDASDGRFTNRIFVRWTPIPGAQGYRVLRSIEAGEEIEVGTPGGPVFQDTNAIPGVLYSYRVCGRRQGVDGEFSEPETGWRNLPPPQDLEASEGTATDGVYLTWNEVAGSIGYRVFRSSEGGAYEELASPEANAYADLSAVAGIPYLYVVATRTGVGDSRASEPDAGFRNVRAPNGVSASDGTYPDRVEVLWNAATDATVEAYLVLRQLEGEEAPAVIGEVPADEQTRFDDSTIPVDVIGSYSVQARTPAGLSEASVPDTGFRQTGSFHGSGEMTSGSGGAAHWLSAPIRERRDAAPTTKPTSAIERPQTAPIANAEKPGEAGSVADAAVRGDSAAAATIELEASPHEDAACPRLVARAEAIERRGGPASDVQADLSAMQQLEFLAAISLDPSGGCAFAEGDLDLDGMVDEFDLALLIEAWWTGDLRFGDFDGNGRVDESDFADWCGAPAADPAR